MLLYHSRGLFSPSTRGGYIMDLKRKTVIDRKLYSNLKNLSLQPNHD